MKDFFITYGWNLLALLAATKLLALGYFWQFRKKEVTLAILPLALLLFLLVAFASFEKNISIGLGILGILSFIRLRSSLDSVTDAITLLTAVIFGILAAEITDTRWLIAVLGLTLIVFLGTYLVSSFLGTKEIKTMKLTIDELLLLKNKKDRAAFKTKLETDLGIEVLQFEILSIDYLRDASKISLSYMAKK